MDNEAGIRAPGSEVHRTAHCRELGGIQGWVVLAKGTVAHVRTTWNSVAVGGTREDGGHIPLSYMEVARGKRPAEQDRGRGGEEMSVVDCKCLLYVHMLTAWSQASVLRGGASEKISRSEGL